MRTPKTRRFGAALLIAIFIHTSNVTAARNCYYLNGTQIVDIAYQPCHDDTARDSACCGINHEGAGHVGIANDVCESNGLCQNWEGFDGVNPPPKLWWRQGCTDPTWQSPYCLGNVCDFEVWQDGNAPVRKCDDNTWCCGDASCCNVKSSRFTLAATLGPTSTRSASSNSRVPASATATSPAATSSTARPSEARVSSAKPTTTAPPHSESTVEPESQGLSTVVKIGIGVGVGAGFLILVSIIGILAIKLRKRKLAESKSTITGSSGPQGMAPASGFMSELPEKGESIVYPYGGGLSELHTQEQRAELDAWDMRNRR